MEILGLRFSDDGLFSREGFQRLHSEFSSSFKAIEIDSSTVQKRATDSGSETKELMKYHPVLVEDFVNQKQHPTYQGRLALIHFLNRTLRPEKVVDPEMENQSVWASCPIQR